MYVDQMLSIIRRNPDARSFGLLMKSPARRWAPGLASLIELGCLNSVDVGPTQLLRMAWETRGDQPDHDVTHKVEVVAGHCFDDERFCLSIAEQVIDIKALD